MSDSPAPPTTDQMQLAGMALQNGVMVLGPTSWAVAVREKSGNIRVDSGERPKEAEGASAHVPLLRGPVKLLNMLRVLPKIRASSPEARLGFESAVVIGGTIAAALGAGHLRKRLQSEAASELVGGMLSLGTTLATMRAGQVAAYHGAEHKAIGGYEQGIAAADAPREHPRCGTQLAIPMLLFSTLGTQLVMRVVPINVKYARLLGQLLGMGLATELFRAGQRGGRGAALAQVAAKAGLQLQTHVTTTEPTREQLDVAEAALNRVLELEATAA